MEQMEKIGELGPAPIEKVLTEDDGRVYPIKGVILMKHHSLDVESINPVPIYRTDLDPDDLIGYAMLYKDEFYIRGNFYIIYSTPERLIIEIRSEPLYPRLVTKYIYGCDAFGSHKGYIKGSWIELTRKNPKLNYIQPIS